MRWGAMYSPLSPPCYESLFTALLLPTAAEVLVAGALVVASPLPLPTELLLLAPEVAVIGALLAPPPPPVCDLCLDVASEMPKAERRAWASLPAFLLISSPKPCWLLAWPPAA